jgi:hypothetical protein
MNPTCEFIDGNGKKGNTEDWTLGMLFARACVRVCVRARARVRVRVRVCVCVCVCVGGGGGVN